MPKTSQLVPDLTGRIVNDGQYKLVKKLGAGAFGVVYKASNLRTVGTPTSPLTEDEALIPETVAIKILPIGGRSEREVQRVRKEVMVHFITSEHEGVVMLYGVFNDDDFVYMVMQYCAGGDLFTRVAEYDDRLGRMMFWREEELVKDLFTQIIDAVDSCHQKGYYHRDLKPDNILCDKSGTKVYLSDFGLATDRPVSTVFGCGTSTYMSPECIGEETNARAFSLEKSDVWSLGVILLNMLTSRSPWKKAIASDTVFRRFVRDASYLQEILPLSNVAVELFRRTLAWDPRVRPTLAQLRGAIKRIDTFWMTAEEISHASLATRVAAAYCAGYPLVNERGHMRSKGVPHRDNKAKRVEEWVAGCCNTPEHDIPSHERDGRVSTLKEPGRRVPPSPQPVVVPEPTPVLTAPAPASDACETRTKWWRFKGIFSPRRTRSPSPSPSSARTPSLSWPTDSPVSSVREPRTPVQHAVVDGVDAKLAALQLGSAERAKAPLRVVNLTPPGASVVAADGA